MIERAEAVLRDLGFRVCRVRHHATATIAHRARDRPRRDGARARAGDRRRDRSRAARDRLPARHARPARLSPRQPERRAAAAPGLSLTVRSARRRRSPLVFLAAHLAVLPPTLEDHRLGQLRARRARLRRRAAPAASARVSRLHRARQARDARARPPASTRADVRGLARLERARRGAARCRRCSGSSARSTGDASDGRAIAAIAVLAAAARCSGSTRASDVRHASAAWRPPSAALRLP